MSTKTQAFRDRIEPYWLLLVISVISGAIIFFIAFIHVDCYEMGCLIPYVIMLGLQWLLVIPATIVVVSIYKRLSRQNSLHNIHFLILTGIPLILNIVGASSFFISSYVDGITSRAYRDSTKEIPNSDFVQNFSFTGLKKEQLISKKYDDGRDYFVYNTILHAENKTGKEITQMMFQLGGIDGTKNPSYSENMIAFDGYWGGINMPPGDSDVEINIEIYIYDLECRKFNKPLSLIYTFDDDYTSPYKSLAVNASINDQLKQIACGSAP